MNIFKDKYGNIIGASGSIFPDGSLELDKVIIRQLIDVYYNYMEDSYDIYCSESHRRESQENTLFNLHRIIRIETKMILKKYC